MNNKNYRIKYPKLLLLLITIAIAVVLFYEGRNYAPFHDFLIYTGYAGTFLSGILYAFGFTSAPAAAILLVLAKEQSLLMALMIGGLGALLSDVIIFLFIRLLLVDEIKKLQREKIVRFIEKEEKIIFGHYYRYIFPALAGFLIASPLPTEIGVTMMAGIKKISFKKFLIIAYVLHTTGIFAILFIGNLI